MPLQEALKAIESSSSLGDQLFTVVSSILIGGAAAALWVRRKLSKDSLEIKKDSAEGDLIQHLEDERDVLKIDKEKLLARLIEIDKERQEAVTAVAKLSSDVAHLSKEVTQLESMVKVLTEKLDAATAAMHQYALENAKLSAQLSSFGFGKRDKYDTNRPPGA